MAKKNDAELRGDFPIAQGYLDNNRFVTPGLEAGDKPELYRLPTLDAMRDMTNQELLIMLNHYGVTEPWGSMQTHAMEYARRMMPLKTEAEIQAAYEELITGNRRALLGISRRVAQQWSTLDAIDGNVNTEMIWLAEDDEATCDSCAPRSGDIDTYLGWKARGMPGAEVCRGGDYCRCDLVVIE